MFHFCLGLIAISSVWVANAARPTLQAATTNPNIRKRVCRLYNQCDFSFDLENSLKSEMPLDSSNTNIFTFERMPLNESKLVDHLNKIDVRIFPVQIGRANLTITARNGSKIVIAELTIIRPSRGIDIAFDIFLWVYVGLVSFAMGAAIHRDLVKEFLTGSKQKEVAITFACQYFIMPLVSDFLL